MELNFELKVNSSEFIEKTEQIRSAMRTTALEIEEQGQKVSSSFLQMADKVSFTTDIVGKAIKGMQEQIIAAIASLYELDSENQSRLAGLRKDFGESLDKDSSDEQKQKTSVGKEIDSRENLSEDINNQSKELAQLNAELLDYQQKLEAVQNELSDLKTEISTVSEEMKEMHDAGQQNTETYAALQKKSEDLSESMKKISADDTFEGITSGLGGLSSAFSTASSMLELFSIENETLQKIMQKVQLAIAITNGLQEVNAVLSKNSAFQLNVVGQLKLWWRNITLQAAAAQGIETAAASTGTVVNLGLAGSFRAIGLAIKSIPVIGWILTGISALIGLYSLWSSHTEEQKKEQEDLNESVRKFNDNIQNYAAKPIATIELLSAKFRALGNDMDAQLKFIVDNKNAFDELGYSINSVKDAQQLLIDNKDKFIEAQIAKATSLAYGDMVKEDAKEYAEAKKEQEKWEKIAKEEDEKDRRASRIPTLDGMPTEDRTSTQDGLSRLKVVPIKTTKNPASRQEFEMSQEQGLLSETGGLLRPSEIKARTAKEQADELYKKMQASSEQSLFAENKANEILAGMMLNKNKSTPEDDTKNIEEAHEKYMSLLVKQKAERIRFAEDSVNRIKQAEIDANADGAEKTLEQLELNQKKERQALEREKQELIQRRKEETKAVFDAEQNAIKAIDPNHKIEKFVAPKSLSTDIEKEFEKRTSSLDKKQLNERLAYYDSEKQAMNEYLKEYGTYIEKRNAIIALGESKKKGKSKGEQMIIAEETKKALSDLDIEANKDKSAFGQLFSNMKDRSVKDMRAIVAEAQNMLNFVEKGNYTYGNQATACVRLLYCGVLCNSAEDIDIALRSLVRAFVDKTTVSQRKTAQAEFEKLWKAQGDYHDYMPAIGKKEGLYEDGTFIQHIALPYIGGYGSEIIEASSKVSAILEGSGIGLPDEIVESLYTWVTKAYFPTIYEGEMMMMYMGRGVKRNPHDVARAIALNIAESADLLTDADQIRDIKGVCKRMLTDNGYYPDVYSGFDPILDKPRVDRLLGDVSVPVAGVTPFNVVMAAGDRVIHNRPDFRFGISMSSSRIGKFESLNNENTRGWYLGEGMTYIYNSTDRSQYVNYFNLVNMQRLPGTTVDVLARSVLKTSNYGLFGIPVNAQDWTGGASLNGVYGVAGMHLVSEVGSLEGRKSWFMFDNEVVALGAGISMTEERAAETVVENRNSLKSL